MKQAFCSTKARLLTAIVFSWMSAEAVFAATTHVSVANGTIGVGPCIADFTSVTQMSDQGLPVTAMMTGSGSACSASAFATASAGSVGIDSNTATEALITGPRGVIASASSVVDVLFDTPEGYDGSNIGVSLNVHQAGGVQITSQGLAAPSSATLNTGVTLRGFTGFGINSLPTQTGAGSTAIASVDQSFQFAQDFLGGNFVTPTLFINANRGLRISFSMSSREVHGNNSTVETVIDAGNTLSFALLGPVFNLPEGFSVNSTDGSIVDNQFVSAVPLPAGIGYLFAASLIGLLRQRCAKPE